MFYKSCIAVFTCASTRAIHLELTPDLAGDGFIRVMKRFMGRRGIPTFILSDNSKKFGETLCDNSEHRLEIQCAILELVGWFPRNLCEIN